MSDHLPECLIVDLGDWQRENAMCICDRLRACEARVREDDNRALWDQRQFNAGLAAARDAVAALRVYGPEGELAWPDGLPGGVLDRAEALAAIDALRGDA